MRNPRNCVLYSQGVKVFQGLSKRISLISVASIFILSALISGCNQESGANTNNIDNSKSVTSSKESKESARPETSLSNDKTTSTSAPTTSTTVAALQEKPKPRDKNAKVILFDTAHGEIFDLNSQDKMGCTSFKDLLTSKGYTIETNRSLFDENVLKGVKAVVIAGPMAQLNRQEAEALLNYLSNGGNLLITVHVSYFISDFTNVLGLQLSKGVLGQQEESFEGAAKNFVARGITEHPLTKNVKGVAVRATWALQPLPGNTFDAKSIVASSSDSWVDITANDYYDIGEPRGSYGIIGVSTVGKGKVVVIGDDAVFTNFTINMAGNRTLCENIADWFGK
jgi:hypothetical protein